MRLIDDLFGINRMGHRLRDDRGTWQRVPHPHRRTGGSIRLIAQKLTTHDRHERAQFDALTRRRIHAWERYEAEAWVSAAIGAALLAVLGATSISMWFVHERMPIYWVIGLICLAVALGLIGDRLTARARVRRRQCRIDNLPFVCVCCGFDLSATPTDPDGRVTCTECAAAWQPPPKQADPPIASNP